LTKKGKEQETLFLPEYIKGYKVELLRAAVPWFATGPSTPDFGNVRHIIIEGSLTIGERFFYKSSTAYPVIEFLNNEPPIIVGNRSVSLSYMVFVMPDDSPNNYIPIYNSDIEEYRPFRKSEIIDGYLIKNNVYMGYIGEEKDLVIPEGVTQIYTSDRLQFIRPNSVYFPSTLVRIEEKNIFNYRVGTVYVSSKTIIEDDAFLEETQIIRY
jgi:hypothetical protein